MRIIAAVIATITDAILMEVQMDGRAEISLTPAETLHAMFATAISAATGLRVSGLQT
jgi:hypothetical protein